MKNLDKYLLGFILILVLVAVGINVNKQLSIDKSKLPAKLETNPIFQKWLTNVKNKGFKVEGDNFKYIEDSNVYNTLWTSTASSDDDASLKLYQANLEMLKKYKYSALSPNEREIVNYDFSPRLDYKPNEVFFYGLREDKILKTKVLDCDYETNCFFLRGGFLDNHVFFVIEMSLKDYNKHQKILCDPAKVCSYTFKVHLVDLINNSRTVYESEPIEGIYKELTSEL